MSKLVTIYGGSGFVGRYIARRLAKDGWRIRVAVRRPNEAMHVKPYGTPGQVEPVLCNIRDEASVAAVMNGADAVVNCVGLMGEKGANTFDAIQADGAGRIARIAAEQGIETFVHLSAIGADADSASAYARTKAEGEAIVLAHMPNAVILRPSVIFGTEDGFFNRFASMSRMGPILPIVGGNTKFQPVYVDDVAQAAMLAVDGKAEPGVYELGGPDVNTLRDLIDHMLTVIHRRKLVMNLPFWLARINAMLFELTSKISLGLFTAPLTRDQVTLLAKDNVVSGDARGLADLGIKPVALEAVLPDYLWRFRPSGQYDAIKDSAKNLKIS
ncbi:dTDP-4-dehydrorhamnose reductase [Thalassovita gelatinovora]|uniref:dTDP-4-dehydrorhamnose reductase n=1 Tax=Thalassovita gelatinovora TaxID=53501 RepID=A0A0P1FSP7_THAGE|nr:complex I NDUFA9 subunit family protein [Thalassovita gelatinovora]QIZ80991.1 complex I NDUFA9 subunit family protein [Thalassovita gelatinovora]CUH63534.1 dTDP-4-dehydrorhamnose reductase [Thalassovita gelatinovora]SEQ68846.1 NADH dehydrogenase [Thalassovita gelatinovora]